MLLDNEDDDIHKQIKTNKVLNKIYKKSNNSKLLLPKEASTSDWMKLINDFDSILNKL